MWDEKHDRAFRIALVLAFITIIVVTLVALSWFVERLV